MFATNTSSLSVIDQAASTSAPAQRSSACTSSTRPRVMQAARRGDPAAHEPARRPSAGTSVRRGPRRRPTTFEAGPSSTAAGARPARRAIALRGGRRPIAEIDARDEGGAGHAMANRCSLSRRPLDERSADRLVICPWTCSIVASPTPRSARTRPTAAGAAQVRTRAGTTRARAPAPTEAAPLPAAANGRRPRIARCDRLRARRSSAPAPAGPSATTRRPRSRASCRCASASRGCSTPGSFAEDALLANWEAGGLRRRRRRDRAWRRSTVARSR